MARDVDTTKSESAAKWFARIVGFGLWLCLALCCPIILMFLKDNGNISESTFAFLFFIFEIIFIPIIAWSFTKYKYRTICKNATCPKCNSMFVFDRSARELRRAHLKDKKYLKDHKQKIIGERIHDYWHIEEEASYTCEKCGFTIKRQENRRETISKRDFKR